MNNRLTGNVSARTVCFTIAAVVMSAPFVGYWVVQPLYHAIRSAWAG